MDITRRALNRIKQIRGREGLPRTIGVRLGLKEHGVFLRWEPLGHGSADLVVVRQGFPVFIDALAYAHLSDYELDYEDFNGSSRFVLRARAAMTRGRSEWKTRSGEQSGRRKS